MIIDSVSKRFIFKLVISILSAGLNFGLMLFFPKLLGPKNYGNFEFAINNFSILFGALSLSVPDAYFNWIARKAMTSSLGEATASTLGFLGLIFVSLLGFMFATHAFGVF